MALTPRQARFVDEYLIDLNATQAAIRSGYSARTAHVIGQENLRKPALAELVARRRADIERRTEITTDKVLRELAKIGFADIRKAVNWKANVTGMHEDPETGEQRYAVTNEVCLIDGDKIDDDTAAAISEISQTATGGLKVKFHDKQAALTQIGRHLGMFVDKTITADVTLEELLDDVAGAQGGAEQTTH